MKKLEVPLLSQINETTSIEQVCEALNVLSRHAIDIAPWPAFNSLPKAEFSIGHNGNFIFLKYYLEETFLKAAWYRTDDPVYKDNCVEFFIAFGNEEAYYNLEFNAVGTCKLNFGKDKGGRSIVAEPLIKKIKFLSVIKNAPELIQWQVSLMIPVEVFYQHKLVELSGMRCRANFYKCGDDLPTPHFLCWNKVETPEPDFHVRRCFGEVTFL